MIYDTFADYLNLSDIISFLRSKIYCGTVYVVALIRINNLN